MFDNPVIIPILSVLKDTDEDLSLYKLMQILEKSGYDLNQSNSNKYDTNKCDKVKLFRKNFIVMNALYQIKLDLSDSGYVLFISSLKIKLITANAKQEIQVDEELTAAALSEYYLNWDNYYLTEKEDVEALFCDFWQQFSEFNTTQNRIDKRLDSLLVLGLESTASWKDIQRTYRQLVNIYHPDKDGNSHKFIEIRQAFLVLKFTQNLSP